ncbi:MAG: hypothetical protein NC112_03085 [Oxalobacter formigenes]|nr:hypothetical protein [Oxalobacter formigenes]
MEIIKIESRSRILLEQIIEIWEKSVRETHAFLSSQEIAEIGKYVQQALNGVASPDYYGK